MANQPAMNPYRTETKEEKDIAHAEVVSVRDTDTLDTSSLVSTIEHAVTHRKLNARQIQLTSLAGAIGAVLFVGIGAGLANGPIALLVGFIFWGSVVYCVNECQLEIVTLFPYDGSFIRLAGRMVDPAVGIAVGWNTFFAQVSYVMFESTIINTIVEYWGYDQSPAILISASLLLYFLLNIWRADVFGEAEFWLALWKVMLALGVMMFTIVAMLGGNPLHDRFGFRYWKEPGPWTGNDPSTQFQSFLNSVIVAGFTIVGPDYISLIAGEAKDPRRTVPRAFKTILVRLIVFYVGGAFCVGIIVPSNDPALTNADTYSGASPYVIGMTRLNIPVLPSIFTIALLTSIVSAGNVYTFNSARSLHALALDGYAPKILCKTNKHNWVAMSVTYLRFHKAMKVQGISREEFLPQKSKLQPYAAWWALTWSSIFVFVQGYGVFLKGKWEVSTFIFSYGILALAGGIGLFFKIFKRTPFYRAHEVDLKTDVDFFNELDLYYKNEREHAGPMSMKDKIFAKIF